MNKENIEILRAFYRKLKKYISSEKKLENDSVLLTLLSLKTSNRSKVLNESSRKKYEFDINAINYLMGNGLLRISDDSDKLDECILTASGIWEIEKREKNFSEETLIDYLQDRYMTFSEANKPLTSNERVVLLSLLGARTFSDKSLMDLSRAEVRGKWYEIFNSARDFLINNNVISDNEAKIQERGSEHPVEYEMRRMNKLPIKTRQLFVFTKNRRYCLDIAMDENSDKTVEKLKYIVSLIFDKSISYELMEKINDYCKTIAYEKSQFVKDNFLYIDAAYDEIIWKALEKAYLES